MILKIPYGHGTLAADLRGLRCQELRPSAPRHAAPVPDLAAAALDAPLAGPPLADLARGRRRVVVLVPDATRKASLPLVLPPVFERLRAGGVASADVTVLVACGTHPPVDSREIDALLGPVPSGVPIVQHDARDATGLALAGTVSTGLAVRLNRLLLAADLVVSISTVQHHYFAGFGGGPKLVFPGVAGYDEIQANHGRVLDLGSQPPRRHPGCEPGRLAGNPVAEEIAAAARLRAPDFAMLMVNGARGPAWAVGGSPEVAFAAACERARAWFEIEPVRVPRIVVSAGGHPSDATLIQAHKALDAACRFAAPACEVLFVAACDGGIGSPAMAEFVADPRPDAILAALAARWVQYGHTTLRLVEKTAAFRVSACSSLDPDLQRRLGFEPVESPAAILDRWRADSPGATVGLMLEGAVYPRRAGSGA